MYENILSETPYYNILIVYNRYQHLSIKAVYYFRLSSLYYKRFFALNLIIDALLYTQLIILSIIIYKNVRNLKNVIIVHVS